MSNSDQSESDVRFRAALESDLPAVVELLVDDPLGAAREEFKDPLPEEYGRAFAAMAAQTGNELIVATKRNEIVGCLQLTLIPGLTRLGMTRAQIEGVRVKASSRGQRIGEGLVAHAIDWAKKAGCGLIQLTSDKSRPDAIRFYERLGFAASHEGLKLSL